MNCASAGRQNPYRLDINMRSMRHNFPVPSYLFLDLEPEVTETAAAGLPLQGSLMDAIMRGSDGSGKYKSVLEFLAVGQ